MDIIIWEILIVLIYKRIKQKFPFKSIHLIFNILPGNTLPTYSFELFMSVHSVYLL